MDENEYSKRLAGNKFAATQIKIHNIFEPLLLKGLNLNEDQLVEIQNELAESEIRPLVSEIRKQLFNENRGVLLSFVESLQVNVGQFLKRAIRSDYEKSLAKWKNARSLLRRLHPGHICPCDHIGPTRGCEDDGECTWEIKMRNHQRLASTDRW